MTNDQPKTPLRIVQRITTWSMVAMMATISMAVFVILVALGINGSSLSLLHTEAGPARGLILGHPRAIRSDEFELSTPLAIGNAIRGLPTTAQVGLTQTYLPAIGNLAPTDHWSTLFRPENLGWLVLPLSNAFAFHWWLPVVVGLVGLTWLLLELGIGRTSSALLAIAGVASPIVVWWSLGPANVLGYGALATAASLRALRTSSWRPRTWWALFAAYWFICFTLILYPPWQVSVGWILFGAFVGAALDRRVELPALIHSLGVTAVVAGSVLLVWYSQSSTAIKAMTATIYPGHRIAHSGGAVPSWLISASFYVWPELKNIAIAGKSLTPAGPAAAANLSEVSSGWVPGPVALVIVAALLVAVWRKHSPVDPGAATQGTQKNFRYTATGIGIATGLNLVWAYVPGVDFVGQVTLLNRVEGPRAPLAIGLGVLLLLAIATQALPGRFGRRWHVAMGVAVVLTVWWAVAASQALPWMPAKPNALIALIGGALLAATFWLAVTSRKLWGLGLLAVLAIGTTVLVNPVVHGLGPLQSDPVVKLLSPIANTADDRVVAIGPATISDLANASGVSVLSGLTYYPDANLWQALDPKQSGQWNNFAKYRWVYDPTANPVQIKAISGTQKFLQVNLCDTRLNILRIDWVISNQVVPAPCLSLANTSDDGKGKSLYLYRYNG